MSAEDNSDKKHAYTDYLRVLLHLCAFSRRERKDYLLLPPRPVKNSDPQWIWDCQEMFSRWLIEVFYLLPLFFLFFLDLFT